VRKYTVIIKGFILIALVFVFNFFLDMLNAKDWELFAVGIVGAVLTAVVFMGTIIYKKRERDDEKTMA
jgi:membrane protein DedA with SNARE-associated domain